MPPNTTALRVKQSIITCCTSTDILLSVLQIFCQIGIAAWAIIVYFTFVSTAQNLTQCKMETLIYLLLSHGIVLVCDSLVLIFSQLAKLCENVIRFRTKKPVTWISTIVHIFCSFAAFGILIGIIVENTVRECDTFEFSQALSFHCFIYIIVNSIFVIVNILLTCICTCGNTLIFSNIIHRLPLGNSHDTKIGAEDETDYDKYKPVATFDEDATQ